MDNTDISVLRGKKTGFLSLGCKVNSYETERMREQFALAGAVICDFDTPGADIIIVNTCSVTNIADRKSRQMLHKARHLSPNALIAAVGCYAQAKGSEIVEAGDADICVGNSSKDRVLQLVAGEMMRRNARKTDAGSDKDMVSIEKTSEGIKDTTGQSMTASENDALSLKQAHTRAFVKIQDGCNQFCSYCIIPYVRGRVCSRTDEDVLSEIRSLADKGFKEVILTGIHLSSYGIDRYEYEADKGFDTNPLLELIEKTAKIDGMERIRLGSLEPRIITNDFACRLSKIDKICPQFHLSLQSGSDSVLKRMNRHYTTDDYRRAVALLRETFIMPALTTDIIVGFPGETEDEFEETLEFAKEIGFLKIHIFKYSRRKGTLADKMPCQIEEAVKKQRSSMLSTVDVSCRQKYLEHFVGKEEEVLFEQCISDKGQKYLTGLTKRYAEVRAVCPDPENKVNTLLKCRIDRLSEDGILYAK